MRVAVTATAHLRQSANILQYVAPRRRLACLHDELEGECVSYPHVTAPRANGAAADVCGWREIAIGSALGGMAAQPQALWRGSHAAARRDGRALRPGSR